MSKHTPGPWRYVPAHIAEGDPEVRAPEGWLICTTSSESNAILIAAAPQLEAERDRLRAQMPAEMKNCTIVFCKCPEGHGRLTATNWVQHSCLVCENKRLTKERAGLLVESIQHGGRAENEITALRARVAELERIRCPDGNRHIWDYGYCKKCRQHAADLIDAALATEGE